MTGKSVSVHLHSVQSDMDQNFCSEIGGQAHCMERIKYHSDLTMHGA